MTPITYPPEPATAPPQSHDTPAARDDADARQLLSDFAKLDTMGRTVLLAHMAALLRLRVVAP